jgi:hypothetical protein
MAIKPASIAINFLLLPSSLAFPYGAGSCVNGPAVLGYGSPHKKKDKGGSWIQGGYKIVINGTDLFLEGSDENFFKGFLFRLSTKNESAARKMDLLDDYMNVTQLLESNGEMTGSPGRCDWDVCGISHTENSKKIRVGIKLRLEKGIIYKLGFTVVKEWNEWYYASRKLLYNGDLILVGDSFITKYSLMESNETAYLKSSTSISSSLPVVNDSSAPNPSVFPTHSPTHPSTALATVKESQSVPSTSLSPSSTATEESKSKHLSTIKNNLDRTSSLKSAVQVPSEAVGASYGLFLAAFTTCLSVLFAVSLAF